jgi:hypothetical protein
LLVSAARRRTPVCMKLAPEGEESKHPFEKRLDIEQAFVVRSPHDEHRFDGPGRGSGERGHPGGGSMTAAWLAPAAGGSPGGAPATRGLRLVGDPGSAVPDQDDDQGAGWRRAAPLTSVPGRRPVRRTSPELRRRRALLAAMGLLVTALALPLSGTGGTSHPIGSALAETGHPVAYTVQPGDTLWSIAGRVDPAGDPRPLVAKLASQIGSDTVVPGEHLVLP